MVVNCAEKSVDKESNQDVHTPYYNNIFFNLFFISKKKAQQKGVT